MAGKEVPRSPFRVRVADPRQVVVDCPSYATIGNTANAKGMHTLPVGTLVMQVYVSFPCDEINTLA